MNEDLNEEKLELGLICYGLVLVHYRYIDSIFMVYRVDLDEKLKRQQ
jgi:hypothetical protein